MLASKKFPCLGWVNEQLYSPDPDEVIHDEAYACAIYDVLEANGGTQKPKCGDVDTRFECSVLVDIEEKMVSRREFESIGS